MGDNLKYRTVVYFFKLTLCTWLLFTGCYGKQKRKRSSASGSPYRHLSLGGNEEILVEKIITLETHPNDIKNGDKDFDNELIVDSVVKIGIENLPHVVDLDDGNHKDLDTKSDPIKTNDYDLVESAEIKGHGKNDLELLTLIQELRAEMKELKVEHESDRRRLSSLESQLDVQRQETVLTSAETIQIRQVVSEHRDTLNQLTDTSKDHSLLLEGVEVFSKDATKEIRRFGEYKERAAKRFHQITNMAERNERSVATVANDITSLRDDVTSIRDGIGNIQEKVEINRKYSATLSYRFGDLQTQLSDMNHTLENITSCCSNLNSKLTNHIEEYSSTNQIKDSSTNQKPVKPIAPYSKIEIVDFGSGDGREDVWPSYGENSYSNQAIIDSSGNTNRGEKIYEGSGEEVGSGDTDKLPPFVHIDLSSYVEKTEFQRENEKLQYMLEMYLEKYENMTEQMLLMDTRISNIQLGNFMQNLQESLINFTQNVITLDQWKVSSSQIVNSTLTNQDQITKMMNMVIDNTDKMADMQWKVSNHELLSNQQFNILKMYIIRLNNSMEDIKEQISELEKKHSQALQAGHQPSGFYGYQTGSQRAGYQSTGSDNYHKVNQSDFADDKVVMLMSRLDELGLQIVFNQNRLGNIEVKLLNESLYSCRKFNMDTYQDSQLAGHEKVIKSNTNSILITHTYVKELDNNVQRLRNEVKLLTRKLKGAYNNIDTLRRMVPAVVELKQEVDHFRLQLPIDCGEYFDRGYRSSGVYVIHPIGAQHSSQVVCHMTKDGGWTVIHHRFDGSLDFNRNWTEYAKGFGSVQSEHYLGNYLVHLLTANNNTSLHIEMVDFYNETWIANYDHFAIDGPKEEFRMSVKGYAGNATDGLGYSDSMSFSTVDRDTDGSSLNCAYFYESGWWYKHCQTCNLNGRYDIGFLWFNSDISDYINLKSSSMRIMRKSVA